MSSTLPEPGVLLPLSVRAADRLAQILVVDGGLNLRARGQGDLSAALPPGIYTVRVRAGTAVSERLVLLRKEDAPVRLDFPHLQFVSPVPLHDTARSHGYHQEFAVEASSKVHVSVWDGAPAAWVFVLARVWSAQGEPPPARRDPNPARGLELRDALGRLILDLGAAAELRDWGDGTDPCAACNVRVAPGLYQLVRPDGRAQAVVAPAGWQTQVFLLHGPTGPTVSIHLKQELSDNGGAAPGYNPASPTLRQFELARLGLVDEKQVLPAEFVNDILAGKFHDPMLGILGAHLLLAKARTEEEASGHRAALSTTVEHLRRLVGPEHPDVEALALQVPNWPRRYSFCHPPMLRRSWQLIVDATEEDRFLVPGESLAAAISVHVLTDVPWLVWSAGASLSVPTDLGEPGSAVGTDPAADPVDSGRAWWKAMAPSTFARAWAWPGPGGEASDEEHQLRRWVRVLGLPRVRVEQILQQLREAHTWEVPHRLGMSALTEVRDAEVAGQASIATLVVWFDWRAGPPRLLEVRFDHPRLVLGKPGSTCQARFLLAGAEPILGALDPARRVLRFEVPDALRAEAVWAGQLNVTYARPEFTAVFVVAAG